jgi:hypothetical protein
VVATLTSRRAEDHENSDREQWDENRPLHPDRLSLVHKQLGEQVNDRDPQAIDGVEQHAKKDKDLKEPVLVNIVQKAPDAPSRKRRQNVHRDKDRHAYPANAVQDEGQHGTLPLVSQGGGQADISFQAHRSLLEILELGRQLIIPFEFLLLKVTILTGDSFQTSSNKESIDLYNP